MPTITVPDRLRDLVLVVVAFGLLAGLIELVGASRDLLLPVTLGVTLALASGPNGRACAAAPRGEAR